MNRRPPREAENALFVSTDNYTAGTPLLVQGLSGLAHACVPIVAPPGHISRIATVPYYV